jgi:hypothetical protein
MIKQSPFTLYLNSPRKGKVESLSEKSSGCITAGETIFELRTDDFKAHFFTYKSMSEISISSENLKHSQIGVLAKTKKASAGKQPSCRCPEASPTSIHCTKE